MMDAQETRERTIEDYGWIASEAARTSPAEWRAHICHPIFDPIQAQYPLAPGYQEAANLGLGCAIPPLLLPLQKGQSVLDLGCASGIDTFIAAALVGPEGKATGIDLTPALVERATEIAKAQGIAQASFFQGDIELLPFAAGEFDHAMSNGVWSLVPDKLRAALEVFRVLKPGGHFLLADLVCLSDIPPLLEKPIMAFTGCFNGIYRLEAYLQILRMAGFAKVTVQHERPVMVPADILPSLDLAPALAAFQAQGLAAASIMAQKA